MPEPTIMPLDERLRTKNRFYSVTSASSNEHFSREQKELKALNPHYKANLERREAFEMKMFEKNKKSRVLKIQAFEKTWVKDKKLTIDDVIN